MVKGLNVIENLFIARSCVDRLFKTAGNDAVMHGVLIAAGNKKASERE